MSKRIGGSQKAQVSTFQEGTGPKKAEVEFKGRTVSLSYSNEKFKASTSVKIKAFFNKGFRPAKQFKAKTRESSVYLNKKEAKQKLGKEAYYNLRGQTNVIAKVFGKVLGLKAKITDPTGKKELSKTQSKRFQGLSSEIETADIKSNPDSLKVLATRIRTAAGNGSITKEQKAELVGKLFQKALDSGRPLTVLLTIISSDNDLAKDMSQEVKNDFLARATTQIKTNPDQLKNLTEEDLRELKTFEGENSHMHDELKIAKDAPPKTDFGARISQATTVEDFQGIGQDLKKAKMEKNQKAALYEKLLDKAIDSNKPLLALMTLTTPTTTAYQILSIDKKMGLLKKAAEKLSEDLTPFTESQKQEEIKNNLETFCFMLVDDIENCPTPGKKLEHAQQLSSIIRHSPLSDHQKAELTKAMLNTLSKETMTPLATSTLVKPNHDLVGLLSTKDQISLLKTFSGYFRDNNQGLQSFRNQDAFKANYNTKCEELIGKASTPQDFIQLATAIRNAPLSNEQKAALFEKLLDKAIDSGNGFLALRNLVKQDNDLVNALSPKTRNRLLNKASKAVSENVNLLKMAQDNPTFLGSLRSMGSRIDPDVLAMITGDEA